MKTDAGSTPGMEVENRTAKLRGELRTHSIDAALILQRADLLYFSGTVQQAHLYVPVDDEPILLVHRSLERATAESPIERVVSLKSAKTLPAVLKANGYRVPQRIGMELDVLPVNLHAAYQQILEESRIVDVSLPIRHLRSLKSGYELDLIRQAARFSDEVAGCVPGILREGMTELELAGEVEAESRKRGHQGIIRMRLWGNEIFYGHIMSGASAAVPSYLASPTGGTGPSPAVGQGPGFKRIERHEPVLVDYVFVHQGYICDHTRIFSLGEPPDDLLAAHQAMLEVQSSIKSHARPGTRSGDVYEMALARVNELGYQDYFMGYGEDRVRFVGHGVGLELDEFPFLARGQEHELKEGMVVAVEPKLVFPGRGVVGIENTHVVSPRGLEQLTLFPEEIVVV